ncbi:hypothetical protein N8Z67_00680 [Amylibacter sp.]|nr:hypothetical protein [Amylibacter sp.]
MSKNSIAHMLTEPAFKMGFTVWVVATAAYFIFTSLGMPMSPVSEGGLSSMLLFYIPVLILSVFLLLYLTRKRDPIAWEDLFAVDKHTAKKEAWFAVYYLVATQLVLGFIFNIGLHFPGTDVYSTGSHTEADVWIWLTTYTIVYTILPMLWLRQRGFSLTKLFSSFRWVRDLWIIVVYWAIDFSGPIIFESADFLGGITASQYAQGIPWGVFLNTFGAGLPVVVMMHFIFIPRIAVLIENKFTVILIGGLYYALFSLFDQGVDYSSTGVALTSFTYIIMTQTLVGMGKATFTVVTGNPFIHFITLHIISARIPLDTRMFIEIFKIK